MTYETKNRADQAVPDFLFSESDAPWLKIKNRDYTQSIGRDDLFAPAAKKPPQPDWAGCALACAEAEM